MQAPAGGRQEDRIRTNKARSKKSHSKCVEVIFDGRHVTASAASSTVVAVEGRAVSAADLCGALAIGGGEGFAVGAYQITAVDSGQNTWTLDRRCCEGAASGLLGKMTPFQGEPHDEVKQYYDQGLPSNLPMADARDRVLYALNLLEPRILRSLAATCFRDDLLTPRYSNDGDWPPEQYQHLHWGHVQAAGDVTSTGLVISGNLKPLREELDRWAAGGPENAWNLLDEDGNPIDWIASAALQTLVSWKVCGRPPKALQWESLELRAYRRLESVEDFRMIDLEGHFNRGAGFLELSPGGNPERRRLSDREQRQAKREYTKLGRKRGLAQMPRTMSSRYFKWYAQYTFLGFQQKRIRQIEIDQRPVGVGDVTSPDDLAAVSTGIRKIADAVGFRRHSRKRTE